MTRGERNGSRAPDFAAVAKMPPGRVLQVRSTDGTRLHAEVFGPEGAPPIVLAHGITCALRIWAHQIAELAGEYRVIAYDHRGHGRSSAPRGRRHYSLDHLAADLDSVLEATLAPGERALVAGHSMGGIAITSWAERYPERVAQRAAAVALINTTTGELLRNVQFIQVPTGLVDHRVRAAGTLLKTFGAAPIVRAVDRPGRLFISALAVGRDADPAISKFVYDLFISTPAAGRGGWVRTLVDTMGPRHIGLTNLTVPTLVIGSRKDKLLPISSSRHIAEAAPNLAAFVELPGGHCAILERPQEVNHHLRLLFESATAVRATS